MIVRSIDIDGDWNFGKGKNDYLKDVDAVSQNIATRLRSFLGDCFFDAAAGIDWFKYLGSKNKVGLNLSVKTVIINTAQVTQLNELSIVSNDARNLALSYEVNTASGGKIKSSSGILLDELGNLLTTEGGDHIHA